MTFLALLVTLTFAISPAVAQQSSLKGAPTPTRDGGAAMLYSQGGAFLMDGPKDWIVDHEAGQRLGTCCVYYPKGSTWDDADTVMYPNIVTKGPGQKTLKELLDYDLLEFRDHNPEMSHEEGEDIPLKNHRTAKLRYFYNVNAGSSEAVAYVDEEKIIALIVVSSRTKKGLEESIPLLRSALQTYVYMDVKFDDESKAGTRKSLQMPKDKLQ